MRRGGFSSRARQPRLGILEETEIDSERRLILVRRDNVEHLILVGGKNDLIVERAFSRSAAPVAKPAQQAQIQQQISSLSQQQNYQQNIQPVNIDITPSENFVTSAKSQARVAAEVTPAPAPAPVEQKRDFGDRITEAFKNPPLKQKINECFEFDKEFAQIINGRIIKRVGISTKDTIIDFDIKNFERI